MKNCIDNITQENQNEKINELVNKKTCENIKEISLENKSIHQKNITLENELLTLSQKLKLESNHSTLLSEKLNSIENKLKLENNEKIEFIKKETSEKLNLFQNEKLK